MAELIRGTAQFEWVEGTVREKAQIVSTCAEEG